MKLIKYFFSIALFAVVISGCKKVTNDDVSFLESDKAPVALSAFFEITQDNSGLVTITPNGEGVAYYEVYYGDATTTPVKVQPGKNIQHAYAEGVYNVKVVGYSITGKRTEAIKQLTVSFRAPENLDFTITVDPNNNYRVTVTATALYETFFRVYFGAVANEVPVSFTEGTSVSYIYPAVGTYNIRVVALSGGAATTQLIKPVTIVDPVLLPLTFESPTVNYAFTNFGGGVVTKIANPQANGINTSANVGRMVKNAPEVWGGSFITLGNPIDFSVNKVFRMKVFSPRIGAKVLLKVENLTNGGISFEKEVSTTVANTWEDLAFDYGAINTANSYQKIVLIFDLGTVGDGSANFTFLFDDIRQTNVMPSNQLLLPIDFQSATLNYNFTNFDGGDASVINNPQVSGINTSTKVGRMVKNAGQVWGGSFLTLDAPINFSGSKIFKMKVFSPRIGAKVLLKVENLTNGGISFEKEVSTTTANTWEQLTFDFSAINVANSYQKIVLIFDLGTMGDGTANFTYLFDDITL